MKSTICNGHIIDESRRERRMNVGFVPLSIVLKEAPILRPDNCWMISMHGPPSPRVCFTEKSQVVADESIASIT